MRILGRLAEVALVNLPLCKEIFPTSRRLEAAERADCAPPETQKLAHQLIQNTQAGMLILGPEGDVPAPAS